MGVSENVVYPIVPNGFADHEIPMKNGYFIGKINPTFSDKPKDVYVKMAPFIVERPSTDMK